MTGDIYKNSEVSLFQPSKAVADLTKNAQREYQYGEEILNKPFTELNDYSVIDRMNKDQRTFNALVDESDEDPSEAWKWKGTRSMARTRTMAMHAHMTANYIVPIVYAQNEEQEQDVGMGDAMRDIVEWMTLNSNYRQSFVMATMQSLVDPVTYTGAEFCEVFQKIKEKTAQGYSIKEVLDDELSGFQAPTYSADQVLITNAYEQNIQRQRRVFKRRWIEYSEAEQRYKDHENWAHVKPGIITVFNEEDGLFYDIKDENNRQNLVQEVTEMCRLDDLEVCYINGIYMGDSDVEANPMKHRTYKNAPKYPLVPWGYQRINEHFYFYKSLVNLVGWDDAMLDALYGVGMNKALLDTLMPTAITGDDSVDTEIIFPGSVAAFANPNVKVMPLLPPSNQSSIFNAMSKVEESIAQNSVSDTGIGAIPAGQQTAYTVAKAEQNAKVILQGQTRSLSESVLSMGNLMLDIVVQHLSTPQLDEITGNIKYRQFLLSDQTVGGKKVSKRIMFDESLVGTEMTDEEINAENYKLIEKVGYPDNNEHIYRINPRVSSMLRYLCRVEPEMMQLKNDGFQQALYEKLYTLLRQDPLIEPEALVRKLAYAFLRADGEDIIAKHPQIMNANPNAPADPNNPAANGITPPTPMLTMPTASKDLQAAMH